MANFHAVKVCAVGTENQIQKMLKCMLINVGVEDPEIPNSIYRKLSKLKDFAEKEGLECYTPEMINPDFEGSFVSDMQSLEVNKHKNGLYTAMFMHDEDWSFHYENFLALHQQAENIRMYAIHADESYERGKGSVDIEDGQASEDYDDMDAAYFYLELFNSLGDYKNSNDDDEDDDYNSVKEFKENVSKRTWNNCINDLKKNLEIAAKNELHSEQEMKSMTGIERGQELYTTAQNELWGGNSAKRDLKVLFSLL